MSDEREPFAPGDPLVWETLDLDAVEPGTIQPVWLAVAEDGLGEPIRLPVLVARGTKEGPVAGITAGVHGNELNGVATVHRLLRRVDPHRLRGTIVSVVVVNVPGFHRRSRMFSDRRDLNHEFPGRPSGHAAQLFAHRVFEQVVRRVDVLVDLHTASAGRVNSLYVRADMCDPASARLAYLQRPQIIVHNPPSDGTLRGAAASLGIPAVTVEIGDPQIFQSRYVKRATVGLRATLADLGMVARRPVALGDEPLICDDSGWLYTDRGGLLQVFPEVAAVLREGDPLARLTDVFGRERRSWVAPYDGVVIGRAVDPVARTGARIVHYGVLHAPGEGGILGRATVLPEPAFQDA